MGMIRRSPAEYYLKYLVSHPDGHGDEDIRTICEEKGIDVIGNRYLTRVRRQTIAPLPFRPMDNMHLPSQRFLTKHRLRSLYFPDEAHSVAMCILEKPRLKEYTEAMLLTGAPPASICLGLKRAHSVDVTEDGLRRFRHYFWNIDLLDFTEMRALMFMRGMAPSKEDATSEEKQNAWAYGQAFRKDPRKLAADLPYSPMSAVLAQVRMGMSPVGVQFSDILEKTRDVAAIKCFQSVMEDGRWESEKAQNYMNIARGATELLERQAAPEELLLEKFNALQMATDDRPLPNIKQLSEGRHTTDMQATALRAELLEVKNDGGDE